jgi:hypothetical protein
MGRSDRRRRSGVAFKCNLRVIIFKSRPLRPLRRLSPLHSLFRRQLMKFHLPHIVVYNAVLSISRTSPLYAGQHTDTQPTHYHATKMNLLSLSANIKQRTASSGMLRRVALVRTDVSEELSASFIGVRRIDELGTTLFFL